MSSRPGVVVQAITPADGGESPNRYRPAVTAELRVFWPPLATDEQIAQAIEEAVALAWSQAMVKRRGA